MKMNCSLYTLGKPSVRVIRKYGKTQSTLQHTSKRDKAFTQTQPTTQTRTLHTHFYILTHTRKLFWFLIFSNEWKTDRLYTRIWTCAVQTIEYSTAPRKCFARVCVWGKLWKRIIFARGKSVRRVLRVENYSNTASGNGQTFQNVTKIINLLWIYFNVAQ